MFLIIKWLISAISILITGMIVPGIEVGGVWTALWVSVFLGFFNMFLRPILIVLTLPINIVTLGLFTFIINALMVLLAASIIKGFIVNGLFSAILFGIVLSIVGYFLNSFIDNEKKKKNDRDYIIGEISS